MTYLDFINLFNRYDREQRFSDGATRLYVKLLDVANGMRPAGGPWVSDFQRSDGYIAAVCGWSGNTVKKHRKELLGRGLVSGDFGGAGRSSSGKYRLYYPGKNVSNVDTISPGNVSDVDIFNSGIVSTFDTFTPVNISDVDTISPENALNVSRNVSNVDTLYIEEENKSIGAAAAALPTPSLGVKPSAKTPKKGAKQTPKKAGATAEEITALCLPHPGADFARLWALFLTGSSQQGKSLNAHRMALAKLGRKPEGFALVMLESAIERDWVGVENPGTARAFEEWQAQQTKQPAPAPPAAAQPEPELNLDFIAQQEADAAQRREARLNRYATV